jgi:hypothetical protein
MGRGTRARGGKAESHHSAQTKNQELARSEWNIMVSPSDLASSATSPVHRAEGGTRTRNEDQRGFFILPRPSRGRCRGTRQRGKPESPHSARTKNATTRTI